MAKQLDDMFDKNYLIPLENRLTETQLLNMEIEIEKYAIEKEITYPKPMKIRVLDQKRWFFDKKALNRNGAIKISNWDPAKYNEKGQLIKGCDCDPITYEQCMEDLEQYGRWKGRKEFVENKKIEGLEKVAEFMSIKGLENW